MGAQPASRAPRPVGPRSPWPASKASSTASWFAARTINRRPRARERPTRAHDRAARPAVQPVPIEAPLYTWWQERGLFSPEAMAPDAEPYVIVMPPPNVTAVLHMGHGLNNTVQDVLVRFERMRGRAALWLPGTDHAGIATQNVVERLLAEEGHDPVRPGARGVRRAGVGLRRARPAPRILEQLKRHRLLGRLVPHLLHAGRRALAAPCARCSCGCYDEGLVYRGHYIINWCPRCLTALSNEEAEKEEMDGHALAPALSARRRQRPRHRRHDPSRDDARRHGRRGASGGRALSRPDRPASCGCRWSTG